MRFLSVQPRNRTVPVYYITKTENIQAGEEDFLRAGCKYDALAVPGLQKIPLAGRGIRVCGTNGNAWFMRLCKTECLLPELFQQLR